MKPKSAQKSNRVVLFAVVVILMINLLALGMLFSKYQPGSRNAEELQSDDNQVLGTVNVGASVKACTLTVTLRPEKRIPRENNWGTDVQVEIFDAQGNFAGSFVTATNAAGTFTKDLCADGFSLTKSGYNLRIKGLSHLRKFFNTTNSFNRYDSVVVLTGQNNELKAGETSVVFDNYVNSLDLSTQLIKYGGDTRKDDLNQDGIINSFDIFNTISNIYLSGD